LWRAEQLDDAVTPTVLLAKRKAHPARSGKPSLFRSHSAVAAANNGLFAVSTVNSRKREDFRTAADRPN